MTAASLKHHAVSARHYSTQVREFLIAAAISAAVGRMGIANVMSLALLWSSPGIGWMMVPE